VLFLDAINRQNPVPNQYQLEATNPCGEQALGPYENCCMASINLAEHTQIIKSEIRKSKSEKNKKLFDQMVNWESLRETVEWTVRWLDDVVDANDYVPVVPQLQEAAYRNRRIGVSIMGLADLMYKVGVRYGSSEGVDLAGQVMEFIRFQAMKASIELAKERGAFPGISGSIYDPSASSGQVNKWKVPKPIKAYEHEFGRAELNWKALLKDLKAYGIRNSCQTTIQPTGAIATIAGIEGYGCEPVFALSYVMKTHEGAEEKGDGNWAELYYESHLFQEALARAGLDKKSQETIFAAVRGKGSCQGIELVPKAIQKVFVVSSDVKVEEHVAMQAALQAFVDNAISKTINFPADASESDVYKAYINGWKTRLKGMTVYVTGSRKTVVLETESTRLRQDSGEAKAEPFTDNGNGIIGKPLHKVHPQDLTCGECGAAMVLQEGCATCPQCGSTHCSL
jgi:ribonucleoside-diphosphate reductase alpha chain